MARNLPTLPTQGPSRSPAGARGSFDTSRAPISRSLAGESMGPDRSETTLDRSAMPPSAVTRPGRSAPAAPKRTSFKILSARLGRREAGRTDGFELFVGQDEFLVPQRLGFRSLTGR